MKKIDRRTLRLSRQTIRTLTLEESVSVNGGSACGPGAPSSCVSVVACPTGNCGGGGGGLTHESLCHVLTF